MSRNPDDLSQSLSGDTQPMEVDGESLNFAGAISGESSASGLKRSASESASGEPSAKRSKKDSRKSLIAKSLSKVLSDQEEQKKKDALKDVIRSCKAKLSQILEGIEKIEDFQIEELTSEVVRDDINISGIDEKFIAQRDFWKSDFSSYDAEFIKQKTKETFDLFFEAFQKDSISSEIVDDEDFSFYSYLIEQYQPSQIVIYKNVLYEFCNLLCAISVADEEKREEFFKEFPPSQEFCACYQGSFLRLESLYLEFFSKKQNRVIALSHKGIMDDYADKLNSVIPEDYQVHVPSYLENALNFYNHKESLERDNYFYHVRGHLGEAKLFDLLKKYPKDLKRALKSNIEEIYKNRISKLEKIIKENEEYIFKNFDASKARSLQRELSAVSVVGFFDNPDDDLSLFNIDPEEIESSVFHDLSGKLVNLVDLSKGRVLKGDKRFDKYNILGKFLENPDDLTAISDFVKRLKSIQSGKARLSLYDDRSGLSPFSKFLNDFCQKASFKKLDEIIDSLNKKFSNLSSGYSKNISLLIRQLKRVKFEKIQLQVAKYLSESNKTEYEFKLLEEAINSEDFDYVLEVEDSEKYDGVNQFFTKRDFALYGNYARFYGFIDDYHRAIRSSMDADGEEVVPLIKLLKLLRPKMERNSDFFRAFISDILENIYDYYLRREEFPYGLLQADLYDLVMKNVPESLLQKDKVVSCYPYKVRPAIFAYNNDLGAFKGFLKDVESFSYVKFSDQDLVAAINVAAACDSFEVFEFLFKNLTEEQFEKVIRGDEGGHNIFEYAIQNSSFKVLEFILSQEKTKKYLHFDFDGNVKDIFADFSKFYHENKPKVEILDFLFKKLTKDEILLGQKTGETDVKLQKFITEFYRFEGQSSQCLEVVNNNMKEKGVDIFDGKTLNLWEIMWIQIEKGDSESFKYFMKNIKDEKIKELFDGNLLIKQICDHPNREIISSVVDFFEGRNIFSLEVENSDAEADLLRSMITHYRGENEDVIDFVEFLLKKNVINKENFKYVTKKESADAGVSSGWSIEHFFVDWDCREKEALDKLFKEKFGQDAPSAVMSPEEASSYQESSLERGLE